MNFSQISKSTSFGILNLFVTLGTQVAVPTLLTSFLGLSAFGLWAMLTATASILLIAELGIGNTVSIEMRKTISRNCFINSNNIFRALRVLFLSWNLLWLAAMLIISSIFDSSQNREAVFEDSNTFILSLILLSTSLSSYQSLSMGILKYRNDFIQSQKLQFYFRVTELIAILITITTKNSLLTLAMVITICRLVSTLILEFISKVSLVGHYEFSNALNLLRGMKGPVTSNLVTFMGNWLRLQGLVLVFGAQFGFEAAGIFAICRTITSGGRQLSDLLHKNFGAVIIDEVANKETTALQETTRYLRRSLIFVNMANVFFVLGFSDLLFHFMTDSETAFPMVMLYSVLLLTISENIALYTLTLKYATNDHFKESFIYTLSGSLGLLFIYFFSSFNSIESLVYISIIMNLLGFLVSKKSNRALLN